jgi:predicted esterase
LESFKSFRASNDAHRKDAQKNVRPLIEVIKPAGFSEGRKYPLFLALHGGNGSNAEFKKYWTSPKLQGEFLTAYLQSSQLSDHDVFTWSEDLGLAKKEIAEAYAEILKTYPVETGEVIIGGFSSGGEASMEAVFAGAVPAKGFVVLCPPAPAGLNAASAAAAAGRGVRGVLLTTEFDPRVAEQKTMAELLKRASFPLNLVIEPNLGHWIPEDLAARIDAGIEFLRKKAE